MSDAIKGLAENMVSRKQSEVASYILFLGAGASISSGCSRMMQIVDDVLQSHDSTQFKDWQRKIEEAASVNAEYGELLKGKIGPQKRDRFFEIWSRLDRDARYSILRRHLWEDKSPSDGYIDLAHLIKMGYVKMILSTNLDNLLEKALNNVGWYQPDDFIVVVNGKDRPEEVREQLESSRAPFKLIKLHGTLESPSSYAFTPEEVFDFEKTIKPSLSRIINQSLIVIGHSMQDRDIDMLFDEEGKEIHFVKLTPPETESRIDVILKVRRQRSVIKGEFDNFFRKLRSYIEEKSNEMSIHDSTSSIEGFLRSIGYDHELEVPHSRFRNLPTLYVKPTEYDDIYSKLEREHVVFIIGEPHLGKTYTAFHLLWEYYQKGYETLHIRHDQLVTLSHQHDGDMKKLLLNLFASEKGLPRIIHFDDPFGETMEHRTEAFAKELGTFLDLARGYERLRIIVTTRLNIFRESMAEVHDRTKVEELEKDIRVHTSYRHDILLDILHRYTRFYNPLWATDEKIIAALDEQLPSLLPAPHNIEFFVRTSETLNSLEEVLSHVENCKELIKALGEWIAYLPDPEQVFLIWLEICSTTGVLFPDTPASKMDFEGAYMETLAYMFKRKRIAGIPINPFPRARDKFDMILIESRANKDTESVKFDFVHPSYHEAFWYAIQRKLPLHEWWELLKGNIGEIFKDFENKVDLVQLHMIERYGTINRDLDQLLLISAKSKDVNEQLIALEHMLERLEQFVNLPEFSHCVYSVSKSKDSKHRYNFLNLIDKCFDQLPLTVRNIVPLLLFDQESQVRLMAKKIISKHSDIVPESVKQYLAEKEKIKARDMMSHPVITEDEDASVNIISQDMELSGIGSVVITKEGKPVGMVTDNDIAIKVIMKDKKASEVKAKEIMSSPLITIGPEAPVEEACELLAENDIRRLPVIENDKLVGIISVRNILIRAPKHVQKFYPAEEKVIAELLEVGDVMTLEVITENEDTPLTKISEDMEVTGIGSVVITIEDKPVGIVTDRDIASKIIMKDREASEIKAKEIMSSPLITIEPEAPLEKACELMAENDIRRLPVMENDELVGIISVRNILTRAPEHVKKFYPGNENKTRGCLRRY